MKFIFEQIFERSPIASILFNDKGFIELANEHAERLFQHERAELMGKSIDFLVSAGDKASAPGALGQKRPDEHKVQTFHHYGRKKDGSLFPLELVKSKLQNENQIFHLATFIDLTEGYRAEEKFRAAVDAAPNGMLMIDTARNIVLINKKVEEIFGYTRSELIGLSIEVLVPDDFKAPHPKFVDSYLKNPMPRSMGIGRELFGRHKSGKLIPVEIGLQPVNTGGETFVISSIVDITLRKRLDAEVKRKTEEIEEFSYRTSHDLRSPLKSIAGMADCIVEALDEGDYESARKDVERVSHLTLRLMKLVDDILTLTKVETSEDPLTPFDFEDYGKSILDKFEDATQKNSVRLECSFLHRRALTTQATRLTQVLDNLIVNAINYSDVKKSDRFVRIQTFNDSSRFFIHVQDNGIGIPEDRRAEVFGMFKRFHSGVAAGSGLGLYIIRKQVQKLGAEISFESSNDGTTFYLEFSL